MREYLTSPEFVAQADQFVGSFAFYCIQTWLALIVCAAVYGTVVTFRD